MDKQTIKEFFFPSIALALFALFFAFNVFVFALVLIITIYLAKNLGGQKRDTFLFAKNQLAIAIAMIAVFILFSYISTVMTPILFAPRTTELQIILSLIVSLLPLFYWILSSHINPKKKLSDFNNLTQEKMYDAIDKSLSQAVVDRVVRWHKGFDRGGEPIPEKLTTKNIDLSVVTPRGKILPFIEKEIHDIVSMGPSQENTVLLSLYGYQLNQLATHIHEEAVFKSTLSPLYSFIWTITAQNLKEANVSYKWETFIEWANGCTEYALLCFVEYGRNFKNIPPGNIKALAISEQDFHFFGAFNSLNFVSIGRAGVAISTGYLLYKKKHPLPF